MTPTQKWAIGCGVSGLGALVVALFVGISGVEPVWLKVGLDILAFALPTVGIVVNFPSPPGAGK